MTAAAALRRLVVQPWLLSLSLLVVICAVNRALQPNFFAPDVLASNLATFLPLMVVAVGQTYVVVGGSIDLSLGATISVVNVAVVVACDALGGESASAVALGVAVGLAIGLAAGLANGLLIGPLRMQPLVTTFATNIVLSGVALWILPKAGGSLPALYYETFSGDILGVPLVALLLLALLLLVRWAGRTRLWTYLLATGANRQAAFQTGLPVVRTRVASHAIAGVAAAVAALCVLGQTGAGDPLMGQSFTLSSVSAVVLGGTPLRGGQGTVAGAIIGAAVLGLINNLIFFAKIPFLYQSIVQATIILAALAGGVLVARR